jgi:hypothetical protein
MLYFLNHRLYSVLSIGTILFIVGCGKKPINDDSSREVIRPPQSQIDTYLEKQDVNCENNQVCPNYIAKLVIVNGDKFDFCTGFLVDETTVATSASCIPSLLRLNGQDCSRDVFFFFPKSINFPAERAGCYRVRMVSQNEEKDPILWRDDVAFLELSKPMSFRRKAQILREGIFNNKEYTTWMIDQQDDFSAIIKKSTCEGIHNSYINPLVLNESSPSMLFSDCSVTRGGSGAPLIDSRGKVRAMVSQNMDSKLRSYLESTGLLTQSLKDMIHGTNFACAPTHDNDDMLEERECLKDLTYSKVDRIRSEMLSTNLLFGDLKKKYEESIQGLSKYVHFGVKLIPKGDIQETEIYPKCFRPLNTWLESLGTNRNTYVDDVPVPLKTFKRSMDSFGRVFATTHEVKMQPTMVQFSLKNLRSTKKSSILMWINGDNSNVRTFQAVTENCSSSLL